MERPWLGQKVHCCAYMKKTHENGNTIWNRVECSFEGIYIGYRDIRSGRWMTEKKRGYAVHSDLYESWFAIEDQLRVWRIVPDERRDPFYVLPDDVTLEAYVA